MNQINKEERFIEAVRFATSLNDEEQFLESIQELIDYRLKTITCPAVNQTLFGYKYESVNKGFRTSLVRGVYQYGESRFFIVLTLNSLILAELR